MLTKHAAGITTRWALEKPRSLEGSGEAAGQWRLEVNVGRATGVGGGCCKETVPRRLRRAQGILGAAQQAPMAVKVGGRRCQEGR